MGFRALTHVLRGAEAPVEPGETIPESYTDTLGDTHPVDFERLVELGAAEKVPSKAKSKAGEALETESAAE